MSHIIIDIGQSRPSRARELKLVALVGEIAEIESRPSRARELKRAEGGSDGAEAAVAPLAGA